MKFTKCIYEKEQLTIQFIQIMFWINLFNLFINCQTKPKKSLKKKDTLKYNLVQVGLIT